MTTFTTDEIIEQAQKWLFTGEMNSEVLADNFRFISPFWESNDRQAFIDEFLLSTDYKDKALSNIIDKSPIIVLKSDDEKHFSIIFEYHTKYDVSVDEAILGTIENGKLAGLKSIYDLAKTKLAHQL